MNTCEEFEEMMSAYTDGELDDGASAILFAHLGGCQTCRKAFTDVGVLHARIASLPAAAVPSRLDHRVARLQAARPAPAVRFTTRVRALWERRLTVPAPALALTLLLATMTLLVSLLLIRTTPPAAGEQQVMYIMSMPGIEVQGVPDHAPSRTH